jgi:hypothetical protein
MTEINRLIKLSKTKPPPTELVTTRRHVGTIAEHYRALRHNSPFSMSDIILIVESGGITMGGIPLRVLGVPKPKVNT